MMILIYLICRYIMLHQFVYPSSRKFKICVVYLRILSRMKAAYYFKFKVQLPRNSYHKHVCHNSRFSDHSHVLLSSVVDHKGHTIPLVITANQSSLY